MVSRYGKKPRELRDKAKAKSRQNYACPVCNREKVQREAAGIWICKKCGTKFASDAYEFKA
jgi:ribosomal protein L37AE/L43A